MSDACVSAAQPASPLKISGLSFGPSRGSWVLERESEHSGGLAASRAQMCVDDARYSTPTRRTR